VKFQVHGIIINLEGILKLKLCRKMIFTRFTYLKIQLDAGPCKHGNEHLALIKVENFLTEYCLLKKAFAAWH
jgi:hypothetical protein